MRDALYVFYVVIAFTFVAICWTLWRTRRRTKQMAAAAERLGLSFEADGREPLRRGLSEVPLFALASLAAGKVSNVLRGSADGVDLTVLDCSYRTGGTAGQQRDYAQTAACFQIDGLPAFTLHPEAAMPPRFALNTAEMLASVGRRFAAGDSRWKLIEQTLRKLEEPGIEFESHPQFTRSYRLRGANRAAVLALFEPAIVDFFEQQATVALSVESAANWLVVYRRRKLVPPSEMATFLAQTAVVGRLFRTSAARR